MIGIENKDSSFFTVESPDISLVDNDFSKNLISLSIMEKTGAMPQGQLQFYDPKHYFSRILRTGAELIISWGYKKFGISPDSLIQSKINLDEVSGDLVRRGYRGFISSPSGGASNKGTVTYNCNFTAFGFRGEEKSKIYSSGTKRSVISQAFDEIGISSVKRLIDFTLGSDSVTADKYVRQEESTYAFLNRMAIEWKALFHVAFSPDGTPVGIFIDANKIGKTALPAWVLNASGQSNVIGYMGELNNVISYKWTSNESESGIGDNVKMDIVDGQMIFRRYVAEEEKVITYRLDQKKIQAAYTDANDLGSQAKLTKELLSKNDFEQIKHFFTPIESTTAPNGFGYRINAEMIGNPLYIPGNEIKINNGFPDRLGGSQSIWYLSTVEHKIDRSGYMMAIEVMDVFNLSPIGLAVR